MRSLKNICDDNIPNSLHSLFEVSILGDVEDTLEYGDIASCLATFWKPISFSSNQGPVELNNFLKKFDWKTLEKYEKPVKIIDRDYYVMQAWNKKSIKDKCYNLIKYILSQKEWVEVISIIYECTPVEYHISVEDIDKGVKNDKNIIYDKDRKILTVRAYKSNVVFRLVFEKK